MRNIMTITAMRARISLNVSVVRATRLIDAPHCLHEGARPPSLQTLHPKEMLPVAAEALMRPLPQLPHVKSASVLTVSQRAHFADHGRLYIVPPTLSDRAMGNADTRGNEAPEARGLRERQPSTGRAAAPVSPGHRAGGTFTPAGNRWYFSALPPTLWR